MGNGNFQKVWRKKMKLINVSNFLEQFSDQIPGDKIDAIELRLALLNEPTVEAIPIEWVKKYNANLCHSSYCFEDDRTDIERMLDDWEKENERV